MLHVIFTETALETVPKMLWRHPSVKASARQKGKKPGEIVLDRALHHSAMRNIENALKRGRPDIIHLCLLEALGAPLNKEGFLRIYVHTYTGELITIAPEVKLPRNYNRFVGLMEQLLSEGQVPPGERALLRAEEKGLPQLLNEIEPTKIVALTSHGELSNLRDVCKNLAVEERPVVFVGGYPHGPMKEDVLKLAGERVSIYRVSLDAWVVTSRMIYQYEIASSIT